MSARKRAFGPVPLTLSDGLIYLSKLLFSRRNSMDRAAGNEADIQAPQPQAGEQARVPCPHEDTGRAQGHQPAETAGSSAHHREDRGQIAQETPARTERLPRDARIRSGSEIRRLLDL